MGPSELNQPYSTRFVDAKGDPLPQYYGIDLGSNIVLGTGNPAGDDVAIGVSIKVVKAGKGIHLRHDPTWCPHPPLTQALASASEAPAPRGPRSFPVGLPGAAGGRLRSLTGRLTLSLCVLLAALVACQPRVEPGGSGASPTPPGASFESPVARAIEPTRSHPGPTFQLPSRVPIAPHVQPQPTWPEEPLATVPA